MRTRSLSGTRDEAALPERLARLSERLDTLEDPDVAVAGGGFVIVPDADRDGVLNIETSDGKKWQIFPPLVLPEQIEDLVEVTTPITKTIALTRGSGEVTVTRVGRRVHLSGRVHLTVPTNTGVEVGAVPGGFLPARPQDAGVRGSVCFPVACQWGGWDPVARCDISMGSGTITLRARSGVGIDSDRGTVSVSGTTGSGGGHTHGDTANTDLKHRHKYDTPAKDTTEALGNHKHGTTGVGGHTHSFSGSSSGTFARNVQLTTKNDEFPTWFDLDACAWDTDDNQPQVPQ
ncbi:hypothetical protein [Streptomyces sp. NPDC087300]|uniref:hypothetical protein n=1 Tax=Streptomyces sp. NPDC087300 TaxID=3365780 RepID=UPI0038021275